MKHGVLAAVAAVGLTAGLGAATSASAVVFADFNPISGSTGGVRNFAEDSKGNLTSIPGMAPTIFTFDLSPLSAFGDLKSTFTFAAHETAAASSGSIGGVTYVTAPYTGSFAFTYTGPTVTKGGVTLTTGELLLGGAFTNAVFDARLGANGGALTDDTINGTLTYTSGVPSSVLPLASSGGASFTLGFLDMSPLAALQGTTIRHFTAVGNGLFSLGIPGSGGGGVPEPATWALMLTGLAGIGGCLRRRRLAPSAA